MKKIFKSEQSGRSMVEMLGVLAIIGVLSVAGIAGYSKAMAKYKVTKTVDQVSMIVANIRTIYAGQRNYSGLTTTVAIRIGAIPDEMIVGGASTATTINNAFQGQVFIATSNTGGFDYSGFSIRYTNLSRDACATISTSDWGSGSNSGLMAMTVDNSTGAQTANAAAPTASNATSTKIAVDMPITPSEAATFCNREASAITWYYF